MGRPPGSRNKSKDQAMPTRTAERAPEIQQYDREASKGEVAIFSPPRLPYHPAVEEQFGVDKGQWKVLVEAIFPAAKSVDAIVMALTYCKSRSLDPFKRPVHIVPMWDSARGAMVETVWPGISELRTTASRTKGYAGCDEAQFGDRVTMTFSGRIKEKGDWKDAKVDVEFPEWCRITVYRVVDGQRCKFVGPKVSWLETYATQGASELPNKMWQERPEGQLEKCAEAAALRRAFPEEIGNELTAEEMIGRNVHDLSVDIPQPVTDQTAAPGDRDQAPPRALPPVEEKVEDPEQPRDGTPPRRAPKSTETKAEPKQDPISSGPINPPRTTAKAAPAKGKPPEPFRVPGTGHTYETWADQYIDLLRTSIDTATVYKWIDVNTKEFSPGEGHPAQPGPLDRLAKGKPSVYAKVKKATEETMQVLRDAQQKAQEKTDKTAAKAAPPPSDMDDAPGEMDGATQPDGPPENPEDVLKWIETTLAAVTEPEDLENIWVEQIEPKLEGMFPPDVEEAHGIYKRHEKRLEP
jgi:phage recombination protein Bet